ncbi:hypothetical protein [Salinisphaera hydrothermalis]|uniref:Uncharacterized protein n=1 Tax=Salinisphaera hydrothermalis (strain C41B8) TaxID=1304275 RepID=A0A084INQ6_SALHC|nr:hypothetical protein [Salinisphaera hydrothermalis]KEZ78340.1 hypothetical protein C41B8_05543 [Salinisphaera hydrothermalis C41B8]
MKVLGILGFAILAVLILAAIWLMPRAPHIVNNGDCVAINTAGHAVQQVNCGHGRQVVDYWPAWTPYDDAPTLSALQESGPLGLIQHVHTPGADITQYAAPSIPEWVTRSIIDAPLPVFEHYDTRVSRPIAQPTIQWHDKRPVTETPEPSQWLLLLLVPLFVVALWKRGRA